MPDVNLPLAGKVDRKYAIAGAGVVGVIVVAVYLRRRNAAAAATSATTDTTGTSTAYDPNAVDPNSPTGMTYAEEASGSQYAAYPGLASGYDPYAYGGGYGYTGNGGTSPVTTTTQNSVSTNSQWLAAAEGDLGTSYDINTLTVALTKVLGGVAVTTAQRDIFLAAKGVEGDPPQGYPPIHLVDTPQQPKPPGPGPGPGPGKPTGLHVISATKTEIHVGWNAPPKGVTYYAEITPTGSGHRQGNGWTFYPLKARTHYTIHVSAPGGPTASISASTK